MFTWWNGSKITAILLHLRPFFSFHNTFFLWGLVWSFSTSLSFSSSFFSIYTAERNRAKAEKLKRKEKKKKGKRNQIDARSRRRQRRAVWCACYRAIVPCMLKAQTTPLRDPPPVSTQPAVHPSLPWSTLHRSPSTRRYYETSSAVTLLIKYRFLTVCRWRDGG